MLNKISKKVISLLLVSTLLCSFSSVFASTPQIDKAEEFLLLMNEKVGLEMQRADIDEEKFNAEMRVIDEKLDAIGAKTMTPEEVNEFIGMASEDVIAVLEDASLLSVTDDGPPCPDSNSAINFSWIKTYVNDTWVYTVVASPVENANHSCNKVTDFENMKSELNDLMDAVQIYVDKAIGLIPVVQWLPYEKFTDLVFNGTSPNQLQMYEARMATRTVHQFSFQKNTTGHYVNMGIANCVHVNVEEIMRKYNGSVLETSAKNHYELIVADNYYNWAEYCYVPNLTAQAVTPKRSYIREVGVKVGNNKVLKTTIINAPSPDYIIM